MPKEQPRKIIHIDCDCFYAAIEMRDDPRLAGRPMAVGGAAERRGVIATCNYEARAFGVRSAMSSRHALKLCPDLLIVKPRMDAYKEASREIQNIFRDYTDLIEPLSPVAPRALPKISVGGFPSVCTSRSRREWRPTSFWPRSPVTGANPMACL